MDALRDTLLSLLIDTKLAQEIAQARQSAYNSQTCIPHSYEVSDFIWLDKRYFTDAVYEAHTSQKLSTKRFGPFKVLYLIEKNSIHIELPDSICAHDVVHFKHTKLHCFQPLDIGQDRAQLAKLYADPNGHAVIEIGSFISYRWRGRGY